MSRMKEYLHGLCDIASHEGFDAVPEEHRNAVADMLRSWGQM